MVIWVTRLVISVISLPTASSPAQVARSPYLLAGMNSFLADFLSCLLNWKNFREVMHRSAVQAIFCRTDMLSKISKGRHLKRERTLDRDEITKFGVEQALQSIHIWSQGAWIFKKTAGSMTPLTGQTGHRFWNQLFLGEIYRKRPKRWQSTPAIGPVPEFSWNTSLGPPGVSWLAPLGWT